MRTYPLIFAIFQSLQARRGNLILNQQVRDTFTTSTHYFRTFVIKNI